VQDFLAEENNSWMQRDVHLSNGTIVASRFLLQPTPLNAMGGFVKVVKYLRELFKDNFRQFEVHLVNPAFLRIGDPVSHGHYATEEPKMVWFP
jgi:hypothetical protein